MDPGDSPRLSRPSNQRAEQAWHRSRVMEPTYLPSYTFDDISPLQPGQFMRLRAPGGTGQPSGAPHSGQNLLGLSSRVWQRGQTLPAAPGAAGVIPAPPWAVAVPEDDSPGRACACPPCASWMPWDMAWLMAIPAPSP